MHCAERCKQHALATQPKVLARLSLPAATQQLKTTISHATAAATAAAVCGFYSSCCRRLLALHQQQKNINSTQAAQPAGILQPAHTGCSVYASQDTASNACCRCRVTGFTPASRCGLLPHCLKLVTEVCGFSVSVCPSRKPVRRSTPERSLIAALPLRHRLSDTCGSSSSRNMVAEQKGSRHKSVKLLDSASGIHACHFIKFACIAAESPTEHCQCRLNISSASIPAPSQRSGPDHAPQAG